MSSLVPMVKDAVVRAAQHWSRLKGQIREHGWAYIVGEVRHESKLTDTDWALCGWPIDLLVEANDFFEVPETCKDGLSADKVEDFLTSLVLREVYRASVLKETSALIGSDGKVVKGVLTEQVDNWKEWLATIFPHVDPVYFEFLADQGAK